MIKEIYSELRKNLMLVIPVSIATSILTFSALYSKPNMETYVERNRKTPEISDVVSDDLTTQETDGHRLPANEYYLTTFSLHNKGGAWGIHKVDSNYCAVRADYANPHKRPSTEYDKISKDWWVKNHPENYKTESIDEEAKNWWKKKKFIITNPENGKSVVCSNEDWGPAAFVVRKGKKQVIDVSPNVAYALFGKRSSGWSDKRKVNVAFAKDQNISTGVLK